MDDLSKHAKMDTVWGDTAVSVAIPICALVGIAFALFPDGTLGVPDLPCGLPQKTSALFCSRLGG